MHARGWGWHRCGGDVETNGGELELGALDVALERLVDALGELERAAPPPSPDTMASCACWSNGPRSGLSRESAASGRGGVGEGDAFHG